MAKETKTTKSVKPAPTKAAKPVKTRRTPRAGFRKPVQPDEVLAKVVGDKPLPELTKKLWAYNADENLKAVLQWQKASQHVRDDQIGIWPCEEVEGFARGFCPVVSLDARSTTGYKLRGRRRRGIVFVTHSGASSRYSRALTVPISGQLFIVLPWQFPECAFRVRDRCHTPGRCWT